MNKAELLKYLKKVPNNEPLFLIRGQDFLSDETVLYWARSAESLRVTPSKVNDAHRLASEMRGFRPKKYPD